MSEIITQTLSVIFQASGVAVVLLMLWHRDRTVSPPIERDKLQRIHVLGNNKANPQQDSSLIYNVIKRLDIKKTDCLEALKKV